MSAPPSPVPTAAPANQAGPADPQAPAAGSEESGAESTPFAAVLGKQMKAAQGDEGKAEPTAKAILVLTENAETATPAADTLSIIASMLAGIAPPPGTEAKPLQADTPESDPATLIETGEEAIASAAEILAAPVAVASQTTAAPAVKKDGEALMSDAALPRASDKPAVPAAIVAAEARTKAETAVETAAAKAEPNRFDALLDAASRGQAAATNMSGHTAAPDHANAAANRTLPVATPVGAHGWDREVGEKVTWMAGRQQSHAELVLNPPQLGRVEVSLSINGDQATATFVSASPVVREALENAIPHLRETLQGAGISLGQAQVGAESFQQAANQRENGDNSRRGSPEDVAGIDGAATGADSTPARWLRGGNGLVDTFA